TRRRRPARAAGGGETQPAGIRTRPPADHAPQPNPAVAPIPSEQLPDFDARVDLVDHRDVDGGVGSEHGALRRIPPQAVENRQRVRGDERAHPLDDVAVVVVMRRLYHNELEAPLWLRQCTHHADKIPLPAAEPEMHIINQSNFNIVVRCEKGPELAAKPESATCSAVPGGSSKSGGVKPPLQTALARRAVSDVSSSPLRSSRPQGLPASAPKPRGASLQAPARPRGSTYSAVRH